MGPPPSSSFSYPPSLPHSTALYLFHSHPHPSEISPPPTPLLATVKIGGRRRRDSVSDEMKGTVGLSILLESQKDTISKRSPQVINKKINTLVIKPFSLASPSSSTKSSVVEESETTISSCFLQKCFLCKQKLLPGKDIYMYKGDRGFCSVECRYRQIFMDEEETLKKDNCSFAATSARSRTRKGTRNRFVY